jgi:type IV pilus assembly protein PilV
MIKLEQMGFSLIEVLVSVFVLALGVIGVASMQLTALRTSQQSALQTIALELAAEMADKMRANDIQMRHADGQNPFLNVDYRSASGAPAFPDPMCYGHANCGGAELAAFDIYEWEKRLKSALPSSRAVICRDSKPWDSGIKSLKWECDNVTGSIVIKIGWQAKNPDGSFTVEEDRPFPPILALIVMPYTK